ncbi:MAG: hypothetical protein RL589_49 [Actinomycetota bacterium]|jgi:dTDP-glucose pyrophosphorylase
MIKFETFIISKNTDLRTATQILENNHIRNLLVLDENSYPLGVIGNHEIRSAFLRNLGPDSPVTEIANKEFVRATEFTSTKEARKLLRGLAIDVLPVLNQSGQYLFSHTTPRQDTAVLILAGGTGSRLYPLTSKTPKPLVPVGGKPAIAHIIDKYVESGFSTFYVSVAFKAELIIEWLQSSYANQNLNFIFLSDPEQTPLGTAGALTLLPKDIGPIIVHNSDVLTDYDVDDFLDFHRLSQGDISVLAANWVVTCPFGVINISDDGASIAFEEKPKIERWINGGVYCLNDSVWSSFQRGTQINMTDLIEPSNESVKSISIFKHLGDWIDIGTHESLREANSRIKESGA